MSTPKNPPKESLPQETPIQIYPSAELYKMAQKSANPNPTPAAAAAKSGTPAESKAADSQPAGSGGKKVKSSNPGGKDEVLRWKLASRRQTHPPPASFSKRKPGPADKGAEKKRPLGGHKRPSSSSAGKTTTRRPRDRPRPLKKGKPVRVAHKKPGHNSKNKPPKGHPQPQHGPQKGHQTKKSKKKVKPSYHSKDWSKGKPNRKGGKSTTVAPVFFKNPGGKAKIKNQLHKGHKRSKTLEGAESTVERKRPLRVSLRGKKEDKGEKKERGGARTESGRREGRQGGAERRSQGQRRRRVSRVCLLKFSAAYAHYHLID